MLRVDAELLDEPEENKFLKVPVASLTEGTSPALVLKDDPEFLAEPEENKLLLVPVESLLLGLSSGNVPIHRRCRAALLSDASVRLQVHGGDACSGDAHDGGLCVFRK